MALGFGFRCGFLGLLHMEIIQERLDREFNMDVITTVPNVSYMVYDKQGGEKEVHNPSGLPDPTMIDHIEEPYIRATIITSCDYIGVCEWQPCGAALHAASWRNRYRLL